MKCRWDRRGFTLVEMLMVLGIIVLAVAILVPVSLSMTERNQVPRGATMVESALTVARSMAMSTKRPHGIRLVAAPDTIRSTTLNIRMAWYNEIQFIEDPGAYSRYWLWSSIGDTAAPIHVPYWSTPYADPMSPPAGIDAIPQPDMRILPSISAAAENEFIRMGIAYTRKHVVFGCFNNNPPIWNGLSSFARNAHAVNYAFADGLPSFVQVGDSVEFSGVGEMFRIIFVGGRWRLSPSNADACYLILDRPLPRDILIPVSGAPNYRIIRQPRLLPSRQAVKLPASVVIDANPTFLGSPGPGGARNPYDQSGTIFMSGVGNGNPFPSGTGTGLQTTEISGLTTTARGQVAPTFIDILFGASGEVLQTSQSGGLVGTGAGYAINPTLAYIPLWLHAVGSPDRWAERSMTASEGHADNQALVCINGSTGAIGSYPVALPSPSNTDPLQFVRTGKGRISANTGP
jgi:prepilin-type N-terminal cleavage/methylation domain-containing protein